MRVLVYLGLLGVAGMGTVGCESILGIHGHNLAVEEDAASDANPTDAAPSTDGPPSTEAAPPPDGAPSTGDSGSLADGPDDAGPKADAFSDSGADVGPTRNEGGPRPLSCAGDSGTCVFGGVFSVGRAPDPAGGGAGILPDGAAVSLTEDGFEQGGTTCDTAGVICVTGAITP
jgi:hypothetical protein